MIGCFFNEGGASFYKDHEKGWFWYQDPEVLKDQEIKANKPSPLEKPLSAKEKLQNYKENLENKKAIALMDPSQINIKNYMVAQKNMSDRAMYFSEQWQQVVLTNPDLNPEIKNPTSQYLRHIKNDEKTDLETKILKEAAQDYGLFLFVSKDCPYCKAFAPVVQMFSQKYGFKVLVVSLQGVVDPGISNLFEDIKSNNGMAEAFGIDQAPALMAYDAKNQDLIPITFGATSLDILQNNFISLIQKGDHNA